jgi:hypothetical protein
MGTSTVGKSAARFQSCHSCVNSHGWTHIQLLLPHAHSSSVVNALEFGQPWHDDMTALL